MTSTIIDRRAGLSSATAWKGPCKVATTANITLEGLQNIDSAGMLSAGDRVLVRAQTDQKQNGIYIADTGEWQRAKDFSRNDDVMRGTRVVVTDGETARGTYQVDNEIDPVVIGTDNISFAAVSDLEVGFAPLATAGIDKLIALNASGHVVRGAIPFVNVKDYGAVGDGVTNDTAAFTAAFALGTCVVIPDGTYSVNQIFRPASNTQIIGLGRPVIRAAETSSLTITAGSFGKALFEFNAKSNFHIEGIEIDSSLLSDASMTGGYRDLFFYQSSNFSIVDCITTTSGAFTAALQSHHYRILRNKITCADDAHDGIIDQWDGSHDFWIQDNYIDGAGIGQYGILATGTNSDGSAGNMVYNIRIVGNNIYNVTAYGILVNGRSGTADNAAIEGNTIDLVTNFHGIGLTDAKNSRVLGNKVSNVKGRGIVISKEGSGTLGVIDSVIAENVIVNANSDNSGTDSGIYALATENARNVYRDNVVKGSTHQYGLTIQDTDSEVSWRSMDAGTIGTFNDGGTRTIKRRTSYTPTYTNVLNATTSSHLSADFKNDGAYVTVNGACQITPTASGLVKVGISLPVASNFTSAFQCKGVMGVGSPNIAGVIASDSTNDRMELQFTAPGTSAYVIYYTATYQIL